MYAIPRKKRRTKTIIQSDKLFSEAMGEKDYKKASSILFYCTLKEFAKEGIMGALDDANSFLKRKEIRRGL